MTALKYVGKYEDRPLFIYKTQSSKHSYFFLGGGGEEVHEYTASQCNNWVIKMQ